MPPTYTEQQARVAVHASRSYTEALRAMGMCASGGAHAVLKKWVAIWEIPTSHFDPWAANRAALDRVRAPRRPLAEYLVAGSRIKRHTLKSRLYEEGLKERKCELCGQGEDWHGRHMSLIIDHINGISDDNRLENLRIVCPNCNATLDTHCGRNAATLVDRTCQHCGTEFRPATRTQRYCSRACGSRWDRSGRPLLGARRVERPPYDHLLREIEELGWEATGRKYGVSGNAIRKWVRSYRAAAEREGAGAEREGPGAEREGPGAEAA